MGGLGASAIAAAAGRSGAANEAKAELAKNAGKGFSVVVPRNHGAPGDFWRVMPGNRKNWPCQSAMIEGWRLRARSTKSGGSATTVDVLMTNVM